MKYKITRRKARHLGAINHTRSQANWVKVHEWLMGTQEGHEIGHERAFYDYYYGNDNHLNGERPSSEFRDHVSKRALTWEQEHNIWYYYTRLEPALRLRYLRSGQERWAFAKIEKWASEGLLKYRPLPEFEMAA